MTKPRAKLRPVGDILLELEERYNELLYQHGLQLGDLHYNLHGWGRIHTEAPEVYTDDGSSPEFYYGPRRKRCKCCKGIKERK